MAQGHLRRSSIAVVLFLALAANGTGVRAQTVRLDGLGHVHGLAVDGSDPWKLYLATHHGMFLATPDGLARQVSDLAAELMAFAAHPRESERFFASGRSPTGGNLGVMVSQDSGRTWRKIGEGEGGPVDFHALTISPVDPELMFGVYHDLQVSRDGGRTWQRAGQVPGRVFALAASAVEPETLYAATREGLFLSQDAGRSWSMGYLMKRPTTMVHVTAAGRLYAFVYGVGLVATDEPSLAWRTVSKSFGDRDLFAMTVDPADPERLFAAVGTGAVMFSKDGGRKWTGFEGGDRAVPEAIGHGKRLYEESCQVCHGVEGTGERPENLSDPNAILAPALDDSAHGWHHSDLDLIITILQGSPREGSRMIPWRNTLSRTDAENLVAYIKSLWSFRSHACQGARHMACLH